MTDNLSQEIKDLIVKYSLENAVNYDGKANAKSVLQKIMATHVELRKQAQEIKDYVEVTVEKTNKMTKEEQLKKLKKIAPELLEKKEYAPRIHELPPLKNTQGKVVTRYAPQPNGEMHLGHAFTAFFAYYYAQKYNGTFLLRFEDTNPKLEEMRFFVAHRAALKWLGLPPNEEIIVSNDMAIFYEKAEELIKKNHAYTCTCPVDEIRGSRAEEKACTHANNKPLESMKEWKKMLAGAYNEGDIVLRLRGDMNSTNAVMRDPAIFAIRKDNHCIHGTKYPVWPLYDFAVAIEDAICKISHVARSAEFDSRIELQNKIRELLGLLPHPDIVHYGRFNVIGSPASKRIIIPLVKEGKVEGWDDIRLVTIEGLKRRGIIPETIKQIALEIGMSNQPVNIDWSLICATNRKLIDPKANRYFFVNKPALLLVKNAPKNKSCKIPLHPEFPDRGNKMIITNNLFLISQDDYQNLKTSDEFRLKDLFNIEVLLKDISGSKLLKEYKDEFLSMDNTQKAFLTKIPNAIVGEYLSDELKAIPKIQWTLANLNEIVPIQVKIPGILFIDEKFNEKSLELEEGFAEKSVEKLSIGEIVQFERYGFVRIDKIEKGKFYVNLAHK